MVDHDAHWRAFMKAVLRRFEQVLDETHSRAPALVAASPPNVRALDNALHAVGMRMEALKGRAYRNWNDAENSITDPAMQSALRRRIHGSIRYMHDAFQRTRLTLEAAMGRALWPSVSEKLAAPVPCRHCGGVIPHDDPMRPLSAPCPFCQAVTQYVPNPLLATYFPRFVDALSLDRHIEEAMSLKPLYRRNQDWRQEEERRTGELPEPDPRTVTEVTDRERAYYTRFLETKATMMPLSEERRDAALSLYMSRIPSKLETTTLL